MTERTCCRKTSVSLYRSKPQVANLTSLLQTCPSWQHLKEFSCSPPVSSSTNFSSANRYLFPPDRRDGLSLETPLTCPNLISGENSRNGAMSGVCCVCPDSHGRSFTCSAGPIMSVNVLGTPFIILSDPMIAEELLGKTGSLYADRPTMEMANLTGWDRALSGARYNDRFREVCSSWTQMLISDTILF